MTWPRFSSPGRSADFSVLIWTTTPWTIPANLALAFHPDYTYVAVEVEEEVYLAKDLAQAFWRCWKIRHALAVILARLLEGCKARHPCMTGNRLSILPYVTLEDGTGWSIRPRATGRRITRAACATIWKFIPRWMMPAGLSRRSDFAGRIRLRGQRINELLHGGALKGEETSA